MSPRVPFAFCRVVSGFVTVFSFSKCCSKPCMKASNGSSSSELSSLGCKNWTHTQIVNRAPHINKKNYDSLLHHLQMDCPALEYMPILARPFLRRHRSIFCKVSFWVNNDNCSDACEHSFCINAIKLCKWFVLYIYFIIFTKFHIYVCCEFRAIRQNILQISQNMTIANLKKEIIRLCCVFVLTRLRFSIFSFPGCTVLNWQTVRWRP